MSCQAKTRPRPVLYARSQQPRGGGVGAGGGGAAGTVPGAWPWRGLCFVGSRGLKSGLESAPKGDTRELAAHGYYLKISGDPIRLWGLCVPNTSMLAPLGDRSAAGETSAVKD